MRVFFSGEMLERRLSALTRACLPVTWLSWGMWSAANCAASIYHLICRALTAAIATLAIRSSSQSAADLECNASAPLANANSANHSIPASTRRAPPARNALLGRCGEGCNLLRHAQASAAFTRLMLEGPARRRCEAGYAARNGGG
jgi:hypothetical protein